MVHSASRQVACSVLSVCFLFLSSAVSQTTWTQRSTGSPSGRVSHAMAFDSARGLAVLFGGRSGGTLLSDTWEWNGNYWFQRLPVVSPIARYGHAMVYDAIRSRVIMFGGDT